MKRKTNKEKYDEILIEINKKFDEYINVMFPVKHDKLYSIIRWYEIDTKEILCYYYKSRFYNKENVSTTELDDAKSFLVNLRFDALKTDNIYIKYKTSYGVTGSINLKDVGLECNSVFDIEQLGAKIAENKIKYEMKDGCIRCSRCQMVVPETQVYSSKLIFRDRNKFGKAFVNERTVKYCSKECAGYDQMAHEG